MGRLAPPLVNRLDLRTSERWDTMLQGVTDFASLPDPTGTIACTLHDNLDLYRISYRSACSSSSSKRAPKSLSTLPPSLSNPVRLQSTRSRSTLPPLPFFFFIL